MSDEIQLRTLVVGRSWVGVAPEDDNDDKLVQMLDGYDVQE